jgi:MoaA/NifB/PqqE/SkfB family radical SAM enzyme
MALQLRSIKLDLTSRCNAGCVFCPYHGIEGRIDGGTELDLSVYEQLVDDLATLDPLPVVKLAGSGEPTLYRHFDAVVRRLASRAIRTRLITNGTTLRAKAQLIADCIDSLIVSVHGDAATHDALTLLPGSFDRALGGIARVKALRPTLDVILHMVITPMTVSELPAHIRLARSVGARPRFQHLKFAPGNDVIGAFDVPLLCDVIERCIAEYPETTFEPEMERQEIVGYYDLSQAFVLNRHACWRVNIDLPIRFDGEVVACDGASLGNIAGESILTIANGVRRAAFIARVERAAARAEGLPGYCSRCCYNSTKPITAYSA